MGSPASAGLSRVLLALALLLGGCAVGGGDDEEAGGFPEELAEPAQPLTVAAGDASATTAPPGGGGGRVTATTTTTAAARPGTVGATTSTTASTGGGATTTTVRSFRPVTSVPDRAGDAGVQARPYGDLALLRVEDDGVQARVTVQSHGDFPAQPAEGEVIAIGVDFYRGGEESDFQLFALGNADGWRAARQEGEEWVEYQGRFELGGNTVVFTVPWSALGGRRPGSVSVFEDWSQARVAVVADESSDRAPAEGTQPFSF